MQISFDKLPCDRLTRVSLVMIAIVLGLFEPVMQSPSQSAENRFPTRSSHDKSRPLVLRNAYRFSDQYSDTTRTRKPFSGINGLRRFEEIEKRRTVSKISAKLIAREKRRSVHVYMTMDHPASSPGRWALLIPDRNGCFVCRDLADESDSCISRVRSSFRSLETDSSLHDDCTVVSSIFVLSVVTADEVVTGVGECS